MCQTEIFGKKSSLIYNFFQLLNAIVTHVIFDNHVLFFRSIIASVSVLKIFELVYNRIVIGNHAGYGKVIQIVSIDDCDFSPIMFHEVMDLKLTKLV